MAQDLRDLLKALQENKSVEMSKGHEERFIEKLDRQRSSGSTRKQFNFLQIAASIIVVIGLSFGAYKFYQTPEDNSNPQNNSSHTMKTLGDLSPNLKKVEDYYLASINLELSKIEVTPKNKELFDGYVDRLQELNAEYQNLTIELNENGPLEETIDALIDNLKLRLSLLSRLKEQLVEFNESTFVEENI
ncbi:MAG: hypothetical protein HKP28_04490 [Winogradskyella sp.]|nr:hypothetical protein [Winogradskyella sp.]